MVVPGRGKRFFSSEVSRTSLVPTQSPIQWVPRLFFRGKVVEAWSSRRPSVYWQGSECIQPYFHSPIFLHVVVLNCILRQLYFFFYFTCSHSQNTTTVPSIWHPFLSTVAQLDWWPVAYLSTNTEYPPNEIRNCSGIFGHERFTKISFQMFVTLPSFLKMHLRRQSKEIEI